MSRNCDHLLQVDARSSLAARSRDAIGQLAQSQMQTPSRPHSFQTPFDPSATIT